MVFWFIILGLFVESLFFYLLFFRKQEFNTSLLGLFTLGITAFAIAIFNPTKVKFPDGTEFSRELINTIATKQVDKVSTAVESIFKGQNLNNVTPAELAEEIKKAQTSIDLQNEITTTIENQMSLSDKDAKKLAEKLKFATTEQERRALIQKQLKESYQKHSYLTDDNGNPFTTENGDRLTN